MRPIDFEAKLYLPPGAPIPENFVLPTGEGPADDFIVSRCRNGAVISVYGDLSWDFSAWKTGGKKGVMHFNFWKRKEFTETRQELSRQAKWVMFALIWLADGPPYRVTTLLGILSAVRILTLYAESVGCTLHQLLGDDRLLSEFLLYKDPNPWSGVVHLAQLLSRLYRIDEVRLGFSLVGGKVLKIVRLQNLELRSREKQTPPIPTGIYSEILSSLARELDEWDVVASECLLLLEKCGGDLRYGRRKAAQIATSKRLGLVAVCTLPQWPEIASPEVRSFLKHKGVPDSISGLVHIVVEIQTVAKITIQAYSGMRDNEAASLPFDCMHKTVSGGKTHRLIHGVTTKLSRGPKCVKWVTNLAGHRAIGVAKRIATAVFASCGTTGRVSKNASLISNTKPLFVSVAYTKLGAMKRALPTDDHFVPGDLSLCKFARLLTRIQPIIESVHLSELEKIDEHRGWRSEERFGLGRPWSLATHQLRRSLALYAQRSGLVTLPSLRRQLQHITDDMTRYYARGSAYAKNIFGKLGPERGHFSIEWQSSQVESETCSYFLNVLLSDDALFGGHAAFVSQRLRSKDGNVSSSTRAETVRMFKRGELHYRETLIGGCTRTDECDSPAIDWLNLECISKNCSNMVGNLARLEAVVDEQERLVLSLPSTSLLHRTEVANLVVLEGARDLAQQVKRKNSA